MNFARTSELWIVCKLLAARFKPINVANTPFNSPSANGIFTDFESIILSAASKAIAAHFLTLLKTKLTAHSIKGITFRNAARFAFIKSRTKGC